MLVEVRVLDDVLGQLLALRRAGQEASPVLDELGPQLRLADVAAGQHAECALLVHFYAEAQLLGVQDLEDVEEQIILLKLIQ